MCIKTTHVSSMQKKSCPTFVILKVLFANTIGKWRRKKNVRRKRVSTSYAMENAKISPLARQSVPMFISKWRISIMDNFFETTEWGTKPSSTNQSNM